MSETVNIVIAGTPTPIVLFDGNTLEAANQASIASGAADLAQSAAAAALAAAGVGEYASTAAGLAATTTGETFWVDLGTGLGQVYRHDSGPVATALHKFIIDPPAAGTAELLGTSNGQDIETRFGNSQVNIGDYFEAGDPDWTNAFERAIYEAFPDSDCINIFVPVGDYILSRQIIPRRTVMIRGAGSTVTRLQFTNVASINATMKGAFAFGIETTLTAYTTNPDDYPVRPNTITAGGADQSVLSDLCIEIVGTRPTGFDWCVWNAARLTMQNVLLYGGGVKTVAGTLITGAGSVTGNANCSRYTNVNSLFATEDGFHFDGTDANNCEVNRCSAFVPDNIGFFESSQFGNSYIACHREGHTTNTVNGYKSVNTGGSNASVFLGCYNEADTTTGNRWDIATGNIIIAPLGADVEIVSNQNTMLGSANLAGLFTRGQMNWTSSGAPFDLGSALIAASRASPSGFQVRGGDGSIYGLERVGDGVSILKDGATFLKFARGAAIADAAAAAGANPTKAEYDALVGKFNTLLSYCRAGTPVIAT